MSTCVSGRQPVKSCAWGDVTLCWSATHMVLHIWGEGTVRSPVGLILLMPPSRIQTLGYFIFTRWAANWKNRRVTEVTLGFLQFLAFIRQGYFYSNSCYCHFCISHLSFRIHSVTYLLLKKTSLCHGINLPQFLCALTGNVNWKQYKGCRESTFPSSSSSVGLLSVVIV